MSGPYKPKQPIPSVESLAELWGDDREAALSQLDFADAVALRVALDGIENPGQSQLHDYPIASERMAQSEYEAQFDDPQPKFSPTKGDYSESVCEAAVSAGELWDDTHQPETLAAMNERLQREEAEAAEAAEAKRVKAVIDNYFKPDFSWVDRMTKR